MDWPTFIVAAVISVMFFAIVFTQIRNRKKGKYSCSCGTSCEACGACGCNEKN